MKKRTGRVRQIDFLAVDMISLQMAFLFSYFLFCGVGNPYQDWAYLSLALILLGLDIFVAFACGTLEGTLKRGYYKEFAAVLKHVFFVTAAEFVYLFWVQENFTYLRRFIYGMIPLYIILTYIARIFWKKQLKQTGAWGLGGSLLIVAPRCRMEECIRNICKTDYNTYSFVGAVVSDEAGAGTVIDNIPVVADYENLLDYIRREWVDEVLIVTQFGEEYPRALIAQLERIKIPVHITITEAGSIGENRQWVERMGNYMVLTVGVNRATPFQLSLKRLTDIVGGLIGCLITAILFLLFALPIYIASPGPIFFTQERVGRNGKRFKLYKFRTMVPGADRQKRQLAAQNEMADDKMFKVADDPRIIGLKRRPDGTVKKGIGSFLRETSLDEFPQMFNVLRGEMSLVGTRPPTVDEWEKYDFHHRVRLAFRPGLTGLWQVSGRNKITDFEQVVKLDTKYIDEWNLGLDVKIIFQTVSAVFRKRGA